MGEDRPGETGDKQSTPLNAERDTETGKLSEKYSDEDFLEAVREHHPATTATIADAVGCAERTARHRLGELADKGRITREKFGGSYGWLPVD